MKQKDYLTIIVAVIFSVIVSSLIASASFGFKAKPQSVPVVPAISAKWPQVNTQYFNKNALDPTQLITIGQGSNNLQFNNQH